MLLFVALIFLAAAAYVVSEVVTLPARERSDSIRRASSYGRVQAIEAGAVDPLRDRTLRPLKERVARAVLRLSPKATVESISFRLLAAGLGRRVSPTGFLAAKGVFGVLGLVFGLLLGSSSSVGLALMFGLALGGIGFVAPDFVVNSKTRKRRDTIRAELPDALDLLAVSVEAGLGFDGAIVKLTENMNGPLAEEFALTLSEMRIGESRQDALKKLADRVATPELAAFVRAIVQADQFGISLGRILKVQAGDTRLRRQAAAEEKAMKAPIKMLFPTVAFIFPAMFLVVLGPAFLNLKQILPGL
jgi:tight adherence protein C